jgi:hypothetical protein
MREEMIGGEESKGGHRVGEGGAVARELGSVDSSPVLCCAVRTAARSEGDVHGGGSKPKSKLRNRLLGWQRKGGMSWGGSQSKQRTWALK